MIRYLRDLRLIPIALIASACLLALKTADLALHSSYFLASDNAPPGDADVSVIRAMPDATAPPGSLLSWAQQMFNFPDGSGSTPVPATAPMIAPQVGKQVAEKDNADITGSVTTEPAGGNAKNAPGAKSVPGANSAPGANSGPAAFGKDGKPTLPPSGTVIPTEGTALPTGAERAILERLQERREELDIRARELDIRESLIQGAEKRMEAKLAELKEIEGRIKVETGQKDDAEATRLKGLVTMYESMKPRDAAKIFNRLDTAVLIEVASQINPRQMAEILAQMSPDVAERLTVELASKAQQTASGGAAAGLPKIEGQRTTP
jgi:flagellar motility protein MotE (MotC chaperone)